MKKSLKIILILVGVLAAAFYGFKTFTKSHSPAETVSFDKNGLKVDITYSRPSMKGRQIFGALVPYGQVWRTGANEATLFSVGRDVTVAGQSLKAGKYTLWTIPNEGKWTIIINKETGQWGTNYNEKEDVVKVDVPSGKTDEVIEQFTIQLKEAAGGSDLSLAWEGTQAVVPIR